MALNGYASAQDVADLIDATSDLATTMGTRVGLNENAVNSLSEQVAEAVVVANDAKAEAEAATGAVLGAVEGAAIQAGLAEGHAEDAAAAQLAAEGARDAAVVAAEDADDDAATVASMLETISAMASDFDTRLAMAQLVLAAGMYYPNARSYRPIGISKTVGTITGGSGYTDGTFALTWSGGNFTNNPEGTFTVSGGVITSVTITGRGFVSTASPTAPTATFTNSAGGTGGAVSLSLASLTEAGATYWTDHATDTALMVGYTHAGSTPTAVTGASLPKTPKMPLVPCTLSLSNANTFQMVPLTGYSVSGTDQVFVGVWGGSNTGPLTVTITGIGTKALVLDNEQPFPARWTSTNRPFMIRYNATKDKFFLLSGTHPVAGSVPCIQRSDWTNALAIRVNAAHAGTRWNFTYENQTFEFIAKFDKPFGSCSFTLYDADGTTLLLNGTGMLDYDSTSPVRANAWKAGDIVRIRRNAAGNMFIVRETDRITPTLARLSSNIGWTGQIPSEQRPVMVYRADQDTWYIDVRPHDDHYIGRRRYKGADFIRYVMKDMGPFQADDLFAPAVNSIFAYFGGKMRPLANLVFNDVDTAITTTNGQVPSTMEPPLINGVVGQAASTHRASGVGHNYITTDGWSMTATRNDPTTGNVDVQTLNIQTMAIGTAFGCDKIVNVLTGYTVPTGDATKTSRFTYTWTFEPHTKGTARCQTKYDPTAAGVNAQLAVTGSFLTATLVSRIADRALGYNSGVAVGSVKTIGTLDDVMLGVIDEVAVWDSADPDIVQRVKINCGNGKSHYENGVAIDIEAPSYNAGFDWGDKVYMCPTWNDYTVGTGFTLDKHTTVIETDYYIRIENRTPIT